MLLEGGAGMVIWPLPRLDLGPSGAWGWSPKCEVDNFWLVIPPLPGHEACGGSGRVWGMCGSGRWRCQAPEALSDHLGNEAEALDFRESLWVDKDEHQARMLLEELSRPFILASWSPRTFRPGAELTEGQP